MKNSYDAFKPLNFQNKRTVLEQQSLNKAPSSEPYLSNLYLAICFLIFFLLFLGLILFIIVSLDIMLLYSWVISLVLTEVTVTTYLCYHYQHIQTFSSQTSQESYSFSFTFYCYNCNTDLSLVNMVRHALVSYW